MRRSGSAAESVAGERLLSGRFVVAAGIQKAGPAGERPTQRAEMNAGRMPGGEVTDVIIDGDRINGIETRGDWESWRHGYSAGS